jgi:hypothetical protein
MSVIDNLSPEEQELLKKLGLTKEQILARIKQPKSKKNAPIDHNLSEQSGTIHNTCLCCGSKTEEYVDFVKRADCSGYAMKSVVVPTHQPTVNLTYRVIKCAKCSDEQLLLRTTSQLVEMIHNLRKELRK